VVPVVPTTVGDRVRQVRELRGISQVELSRRAGLRPDAVGSYERERSDKVDMQTIKRLARVLDIAPGWLLVGNMKPHHRCPWCQRRF